MLTGICFCADCGGALTTPTRKSRRHRYYTRPPPPPPGATGGKGRRTPLDGREGGTGWKGRSMRMERVDDLVAGHLEERLLDPERLEQVLSIVLDRRQERAERRAAHAVELRKKAAEAEVRLKRLYDAIEKG